MKAAREVASVELPAREAAVDRSTFDQVMVPVYAPSNVVPVRAKGLRVIDRRGDEYLDFTGGIGVTNLGHCHDAVVQALVQQASQLWHVGNGFTNEPVLRLAKALTEATFADRAFFCNSGAEANEAALKLARKYATTKGHAEKRRIVSCYQSFHGRTLFTVSVGGQPKYSEGFGPLPPEIEHIPYNDVETAVETIGPDVCAVIVEPILGEGGVIPADRRFLQTLRERCDATGAVLIFDEVQCGMGRTGSLYAYMDYGVVPDVLTTAKALGNGYPIGAMLAKEEFAKALTVLTHGTTYGGNPLAATVALTVFNVINDPAFLARVKIAQTRLWDGARALIAKYPNVFEQVRGAGLMLGLVLSAAAKGKAKELQKLVEKEKLLVLIAGYDVLRMLPALVVSDAEIDEALQKIDRATQVFAQTLRA